MKKFNLQEYLANPSRQLVTRDGSKARIICTDAKTEYPVIALVERNSGAYEEAISYTRGGHYLSYESSRVNDLFFAPEKHEGWMNLYKRDFGLVQGDLVRDSEEVAKKIASGDEDYITTIKVEWEE